MDCILIEISSYLFLNDKLRRSVFPDNVSPVKKFRDHGGTATELKLGSDIGNATPGGENRKFSQVSFYIINRKVIGKIIKLM